jgi:CHAT domain-containing protein
VIVEAAPPSASELARRLIDGGLAAPAGARDARTLALAWALKDACYAAWSSEPQRAAKAAEALRALCGPAPAGANVHARELHALADWTAGIAHLTRGRMADAAQSLDRAAAGFRGLGQAAHAANTQVPKIMALSMLGRYDDAIACAEQAQREFVALGDAQGAGKVSLNLGALHERRGAYAQAAHHSRQASVFFARVGDHERSVQADINLADALTSLGDFDEALRIYARAQMRATTHGFPVLQALVEMSLALLRLARGQYRDALAGFEAARRQYEQLDHPQNLAIAEKQLADTYLELRLLPEAVALFDQVLARFEALDVPDEQAWTLAQRGRAQALLARPTQAAQSLERAGALFAAQGSGVGVAAVTLAGAELALAAADAGRATALAAHAAQGFVAAGLTDGRLRADVVRAHALLLAGSAEQARALFSATLDSARSLQLLTVQVRCLSGQGAAAQALGDTAAAQAAFDAAIELFEDQRRALPGDELRSAFLSDHLAPYQGLLRIALQAHAQAPSPASATAVLQQLERVRARSLGERLDAAGGVQNEPATQALRQRLNWLYRQVQRLHDEGQSAAALTDELHRTEHALLEGVRRVRLGAPADAPSDDAPFDAPALQSALGEGDALIEYGVQDDELFACIVSAQGVRLQRRIASWREVQEALRAASFQIEALRHGAAPVQQHLASLTTRAQRRLAQLHALIWAPLARCLVGCRRVLIVPHGPLGTLAFAALHDGQHALAERFDLAVVPSARLALRGLQRPPAMPQRALALGESSRLPHAAEEARFVAGLFAQGQAFVGEQATIETLVRHAPQADVIHLACHAQFRSDNPMFSALHLHDGALTVERAESLPLVSAIVVLSACETGLAEHGNGDERVGLVRAFLVAGASRVLASLWPVDDEITAAFMASFYGALRRGQSPAAALRTAQTELQRQHPHPFYWAAFTLHGGW